MLVEYPSLPGGCLVVATQRQSFRTQFNAIAAVGVVAALYDRGGARWPINAAAVSGGTRATSPRRPSCTHARLPRRPAPPPRQVAPNEARAVRADATTHSRGSEPRRACSISSRGVGFCCRQRVAADPPPFHPVRMHSSPCGRPTWRGTHRDRLRALSAGDSARAQAARRWHDDARRTVSCGKRLSARRAPVPAVRACQYGVTPSPCFKQCGWAGALG
eukprot:357713-Chlamydomonas_euryale.AAC.19